MPQRWAMWMAVHGDLRFASHHDMMRVIERTLLRAKLPLKYSQGFSPRAIISLAFPRPVGVAARCDLLVLSLDSPVLRDDLLSAVNGRCPQGLSFSDAVRLAPKTTPQPTQCTYQIPINPDRAGAITEAITEFSNRETFEIQRTKPPKRGRKGQLRPPVTRTLDLKLLVDEVRFDRQTLSWRQKPHQTRWAKPTEAMSALGLDPDGDLASVTRTSLVFEDINEYSGPDDEDLVGGPDNKTQAN